MNNFRQLAEDYKDFIIRDNETLWSRSITHEYIAIDGQNIRTSRLPFILDEAKAALIIYHYTYTVQTAWDYNFFALFINESGCCDDAVELSGWRLRFSNPITGLFRTDGSKRVIITNSVMKLEINVPLWNVADYFPRLWKLFQNAIKCSTQMELDYLGYLYKSEECIDELSCENMKLGFQNMILSEKIRAYEKLLDKISQLIDTQSIICD